MRVIVTAIVGIILSFQIEPLAAGQWHAGVARINITPDTPLWMSGYSGRNRTAQGKLTDLWAKALVLQDDSGRRTVLVTIDLIGIDRELSQSACRRIEKQFKMPRDAIALCCSHTHTGPVVGNNLRAMYTLDDEQSKQIAEYSANLTDKLVDVVGAAINDLRPVNLNWGIGRATFAVNRRNNPEPEVPQRQIDGKLVGPVDHDVPVLAISEANGHLRAIVCGYACHATVLSDYQWSGDWPGFAQIDLEQRHAEAITLFWAGCGADQNPLPRRSIVLAQQYGRQLADAVDAVLASGLKPVAPRLETAYEEIDLAFASLPSREELTTVAEKSNFEGRRAKQLLAQWDRDGRLSPTYPYPVQAWRLGDDLTWVFLGGEVVVDYSLRLKRELSPQTAWITSYANDVMAYIPSRRVLLEGGYEGGDAMLYYGQPSAWNERVEECIIEKIRNLTETDFTTR